MKLLKRKNPGMISQDPTHHGGAGAAVAGYDDHKAKIQSAMRNLAELTGNFSMPDGRLAVQQYLERFTGSGRNYHACGFRTGGRSEFNQVNAGIQPGCVQCHGIATRNQCERNGRHHFSAEKVADT